MDSASRPPAAPPGRWTSLWVVALLSLIAQLYLCQFFSLGQKVPESIDVDPSNLWRSAVHCPPRGEFLVTNWLGVPALPAPLNPFSLAAHLAPWLFFTAYVPVLSTLALLAMAAFLRELELAV
jgi:ABC-type Na+ efflux pump permease subunit